MARCLCCSTEFNDEYLANGKCQRCIDKEIAQAENRQLHEDFIDRLAYAEARSRKLRDARKGENEKANHGDIDRGF